MNIEFESLPEKTIIFENNGCNMRTFKTINGNLLSLKMPVDSFMKFYINVHILDDIRQTLISYTTQLNDIQAKMVDKETVDGKYLMKKDANFQKSVILTEDRLKSLLEKYCNEMKIKIDIESCKAHSRSVASSLANSLGMIAMTAKQSATSNNLAIDSIIFSAKKMNKIKTQLEDIKNAIGQIKVEPSGGETGTSTGG